MTDVSCPQDADLLPLAVGETSVASVEEHVAQCPCCRQRLGQMQAEVQILRRSNRETEYFASLPLNRRANSDTRSQELGAAKQATTREEPPATTTDWRTRATPLNFGDAGSLSDHPPGIPTRIGKYTIVAPLDQGGQAHVYRVLHPSLGKELVLKLGRGSGTPTPAVLALVEEGKVLADLEHPNLARIYDLDFHGGQPFLVMEYIRGRTLDKVAREDRPTPWQAALIVARIARALAVAHRRGITHQDIKPRNILIDEAGQPRLIDFGLARLDTGSEDQVGTGVIRGTPSYMAPEQARGEAARIGPKSDIFALGAVLHFLLVGKSPFRGKSLSETVEQAARGKIDREALHAAGVPRRLEVICLRAMATDPEQRYARAEDLAADLERYVRRPRTLALILGGGAALAMLLGISVWATHSRSPAVQFPHSFPEITVLQGEQVLSLKHAVPLRGGDRLRIACEVPRDCHIALFWIDSDGQLTPQRPLERTFGDTFDQLHYPASPAAVPLEGKPGTEVALVCARRSASIAPEELAELIEPGPWPTLPAMTVVRMNGDRIETESRTPRSLGKPEKVVGATAEVEARMERLRTTLRERLDFVAAVAFSHGE